MQNNFEKDVRQKMDELKLTPSAAVWERVEVEIKGEKRKRRGFLWFLLAGLLLPGGWWFVHQPQKGSDKKTDKETTAQTAAKSKQEDVGVSQTDAENRIPPGYEKAASPKPQQILLHIATLRKKQKGPTTSLTVSHPAKLFFPQQNGKVKNQLLNDGPRQSMVTELHQNKTTSIQTRDPKVSGKTNAADTPAVAKQTLPASVDSTKRINEAKENASPKADSVLKKKVASAGGWRRQITFGAGISGHAEGPFFQAFNSTAGNAFYAAQNSVSSPAVVAAQPSKMGSGFAFSFGFLVSKSGGKRWELSFGLQYAYASTRQKVGEKKSADTAVQFGADKATANGFYTNTGGDDYTNRFHFAEVPVSLSFKPSLRLPLVVSMGAAYGRLLATNALTYSRASNLYYQNKENYRRNAVSLSSSAQIQFFTKKKASLRTGPFVQYNLLKLQKENTAGIPHLLTAGLRTAIIF